MFHSSRSSFESDSENPSMARYVHVHIGEKKRTRTLTMLTGKNTLRGIEIIGNALRHHPIHSLTLQNKMQHLPLQQATSSNYSVVIFPLSPVG